MSKNGDADSAQKNEKRSSMPLMGHESNLRDYIDLIQETQSFETLKKHGMISHTPIKKRGRKYLDSNLKFSGTPQSN